jgi:hypothetical protein
MKPHYACALVTMWSVSMIVTLGADTLVLKDGRRMEGQLITVRDGVIEFEQRRAQGGRERVMIDRVDVRRIELDDVENDPKPDPAVDRGRGAASSSRPSGLTERSVVVDATVAWNDTGLDVRAGQAVYVSASDRIRWAPGRRSGPEGEHNSPDSGARPMPGQRRASLIGRVGDSKNYFLVGDNKGPIRMPSSGRLYLGVNDDSLQDNAGSFRVTIFYMV